MQEHEPNASERNLEPTAGNERAALQEALTLCPFPALLVEADTGRVIVANEPAHNLQLPPFAAANQSQDYSAQDSDGKALPLGELLSYLLHRANESEGVEINWRTPQRSLCMRVFARTRPAAAGRQALTLLTFLDITPQKIAEKQARQTVEARDEFLSIAAHELRDPLFALQLSLQFLRHSAARQGAIPAHIAQHLEVSDRQAERLRRLIENLLDVARIASQRLEVESESFDLRELACEATQRFQAKAHALGSVLEIEDGEPVVGVFDRVKMEQVLGNLLSNAIKYGGGKPVTVRIHNEGERVVLEVEDRGSGIAPEDQQRIFERFERASDGHKKESLGLGLYITRALVEGHGGRITVRSAPGQGTTFTVTLPRQPPQAREQKEGETNRS